MTNQDAIDYVAKIEASWGQSGVVLFVGVDKESTPEFPVVEVRTEENLWSVWVEHGLIYGEC